MKGMKANIIIPRLLLFISINSNFFFGNRIESICSVPIIVIYNNYKIFLYIHMIF